MAARSQLLRLRLGLVASIGSPVLTVRIEDYVRRWRRWVRSGLDSYGLKGVLPSSLRLALPQINYAERSQ